MTINWKKSLVSQEKSILDVLNIMEESSLQTAVVVDNNKLLGIVTDGDVRRAILKGKDLSSSVSSVMNKKPVRAHLNDPKDRILAIMREKSVNQIPIVDDLGNVVYLETRDNLLKEAKKDNLVVIMAGGLGTRLHPLTENCPKPMLKVGKKPILELILESFLSYGFYKFSFAVNYKSDIIKDYFKNGEEFGAQISYLEEEKRLGTAGALSLMQEVPEKSIIVVNGDILTNINFSHLVAYQEEVAADAIMCIREYSLQVPFGVVEFTGKTLNKIIEKPKKTFFVNAGIYMLTPKLLELIPKDEFFDMTNLFEKLIENNYKVSPFSVSDYWIDIGRKDDYERANREFFGL